MRHGPRTICAGALILLLGAADNPPAHLELRVEGLRSHKGQVLICLVTRARGFPDCSADPSARRLAIPAAQAGQIDLGPLAPGTYAIALLHDENGNGKADMALFIPREGFGFSRNPAIRMGPPSFGRAAFEMGDSPVSQTVRMRYMF